MSDVPNDPDALRADIEQTRRDLGDTVEQLAHKADVPGRVKDSVHDGVEAVRDTAAEVADRTGDLAGQVADTTREVAGQVEDRASRLADQVGETAHVVVDRTQQIAGEIADRAVRAVESLPPTVRERARQPVVLAAAGAVVLIAVVWLVRGRRS
ncbi:hypothetical protein GCM10022243_56120 [Saccharothrix violaceirubra]|uniref:Methyl-accepting chemotaxis protein n=1 Tax=Saccharothrix violaceirubra TaxID=413306 RepID=A0A7W7T5T3_9PSEU|nr:DUF3618 domain-containing protein [Saccharothrix violaceirubra]MBB4967123.1 methyl-accepting chemotaxis protein [Saccharothrix violaceirubra]